jgi:hypothetical protein
MQQMSFSSACSGQNWWQMLARGMVQYGIEQQGLPIVTPLQMAALTKVPESIFSINHDVKYKRIHTLFLELATAAVTLVVTLWLPLAIDMFIPSLDCAIEMSAEICCVGSDEGCLHLGRVLEKAEQPKSFHDVLLEKDRFKGPAGRELNMFPL